VTRPVMPASIPTSVSRPPSSPSQTVFAGLGCVSRIWMFTRCWMRRLWSHITKSSGHPEIFDGVRLHRGQAVAVIRHNARVILSCERVILDFLQRLSGIATLTGNLSRRFLVPRLAFWTPERHGSRFACAR